MTPISGLHPDDARAVTLRRLLSHTAGLSLHGYPGCWPPEPVRSLEASLSGDTWTSRRVTSAAGASSLTLDVATGDVHLAVGTDVIRHFVSANDGKTWTGAVVPNSADAYSPMIRINPVSGDVGIAAIGDGGIVFFLAR